MRMRSRLGRGDRRRQHEQESRDHQPSNDRSHLHCSTLEFQDVMPGANSRHCNYRRFEPELKPPRLRVSLNDNQSECKNWPQRMCGLRAGCECDADIERQRYLAICDGTAPAKNKVSTRSLSACRATLNSTSCPALSLA